MPNDIEKLQTNLAKDLVEFEKHVENETLDERDFKQIEDVYEQIYKTLQKLDGEN